MTDADVGVWVYAIAHADAVADRTAGLRGVAGEPIRAVHGANLAAAVGTVSLDEFRAATLPDNLKDATWFAAKARAHHAVVSAVRRGGPVLPVRMATIYRDDWRVCRLLLKDHEDFDMALRRVSGKEELSVRAFADPKSLAIQGDLIHSESAESRPVVAHLLRRRRQLASQQYGYRLAAAEAERVHAALLRRAVDGKRKPTDWSLYGPEGIMLNGAYLVDGGVVDKFTETVASLDRSTARIRLEVSGPRPPYSFAEDLIAV
jgi:hypothetical protein